MGTVGLSFGSPTSGTGFDVSATVSQIVANLENVETPWKTQLSTLESQDTVLSNLGTLLSSLSSDISQLTDFSGIMAQKTGSSSDTNVLELTDATSAALAGTHTVVVQNLAQTSSGYLSAITNGSDQLSGSISIQVGTGTAHTVTVSSSSNTLAGLASAINAAGVGVTASVLTDSTGSRLSLVSGTSGGAGILTVNSSIVDATAGNTTLGYNVAVGGKDAALTVDGVDLTSASNTVTNLIPGVTFQLLAPSATESDGSLEQVQVIIGNDNSGVESAVNQMVSDYNSLISAINTQQGKDSSGNAEPLFGSPTLSLLEQQLLSSLNLQNPNGNLDAIEANSGTTLSGSITIQVGGGTAQTIDVPSSNNTLEGLADAINAAQMGVTAGITTQNGQSTLSLLSQTAGSAGALAVTTSLTATSDTALNYTATPVAEGSDASGALDTIPSAADVLSGSITIQAGGGTAQTITLDSSDNTLQELADAINGTAGIGVTAAVTSNSDGSAYLTLSQTSGTPGDLTVTSNLLDTTNTTSTALNYTNSSDISTLANLGITVSQQDDGSLSFDDGTLDDVLNTDYAGVLGFFQNVNSWGQGFATMLENAGTSSPTGVIALAQSANSNTESTLNAEISKEQTMVSAEQTSLTAELNSANEIMQELPSQLQGVNELYAAITGYNENTNS
ncbi:MAG TPA: flagellar filament capping protein FliD [Terracidiphilus sp.]|nr:flagellar filament capping protein FliD [Terracidiphilus sp.]